MKKTFFILCITVLVGGIGWSFTGPVEPMYEYRLKDHDLPDPTDPDGTIATRCLLPGNTCRFTTNPID